MSSDTSEPSTSIPPGVSKIRVTCRICAKTFTERGINIHLARCHAQDSVPATINIVNPDNNKSNRLNSPPAVKSTTCDKITSQAVEADDLSDLDISPITDTNIKLTISHVEDTNEDKKPCPYCDQFYVRINTHISRSHPEIHRNNILLRQPQSSQRAVSNEQHINQVPETVTEDNSNIRVLNPLDTYKETLRQFNNTFGEDMSDNHFDCSLNDFAKFLSTSIDLLPGPKHPAKKYYEARKARREFHIQKGYKNSSNPQRSNKRDKEKRRNKYKYEEIQYLYYNQRKKAIRKILQGEMVSCKQTPANIHSHFSQLFSSENNELREHYEHSVTEAEQCITDETFDNTIYKEEIIKAMKGTSPGPDGVLLRPLKDDTACAILAKIATRMLSTGYVPSLFRKARSVLIYKNGNAEDLSNWRPITICSIFRRIIERAYDARFRNYVQFSEHQRGFTNSPGTILNTALLRSILQSAKSTKRNCTVVFLDIKKAFDNVGHQHLKESLEHSSLPSKLSQIIFNLQKNNFTTFQVDGTKTEPIPLQRGVMQGSPLSPSLYNLATDHLFHELSEKEISSHYGYSTIDGVPPLTILGFADDTVLIGSNKDSAVELTKMALQRFTQIGMEISVRKSIAIQIIKGKIRSDDIEIFPDFKIRCISHNECIKYLGVNFADSVIFDPSTIMSELKHKLELLTSTPWLKSNQKFNVLNSIICPTLLYQFMSVPLEKIPNQFLQDADKMIKTTLKEILSLPTDIPNAMIYSDKHYKGLGLFRASWEAVLQQMNSIKILLSSENETILKTRDLQQELSTCLTKLDISDVVPNISTVCTQRGKLDTQKIRKVLREKEFNNWCKLNHKGKGVCLYKEFVPANKWINKHDGLSCSEWTEAIKMTANVAAVRTVPGRSQDTHCRRCGEFETLSHVLGSCQFGAALRNQRHHHIRSMIANALRVNGFTVHEEVHGISNNGGTRRIDMIAFKPGEKKGYIFDPTIRFESHENQPSEVDEEKKAIYEPTVPYYMTSYQLNDIKVMGLMIGARGTIPRQTVTCLKPFGISNKLLVEIGLQALKGSLTILRHHLYSSQP